MLKTDIVRSEARAENLLQNLRKEVDEIIDRHPKISPDNAFVTWFLRAFIVENEARAIDVLIQSITIVYVGADIGMSRFKQSNP